MTITTYTPDEIDTFAAAHPEHFRGQLWERCRCGAEPVYMPSHRCPQCILRGAGRPRVTGEYQGRDAERVL